MGVNTGSQTGPEEVVPTGFAALLAISRGEAAGIPAVPDGFIPPNLDLDYVFESRSWTVYVVCIVSMSVAFMTVCGRLISKAWLSKRLSKDDYAIIPALILTILLTLHICLAVKYGGMGKHMWDVTYAEVQSGIKIMFSHTLIYVTTMFFIKFSFLLFLHRIFYSTASPRVQNALLGFCIFHICFLVACIFTFAFQCSPPAAGWSLSIRLQEGTKCKTYLEAYYALNAIHVISDLAIVALPIALIWKLSLRGRKKFAVSVLLGSGGLACICALIRMAHFFELTTHHDLSWITVKLAIWSQLEATIAITATSVPGIKMLATRRKELGTKSRLRNRGYDLESIHIEGREGIGGGRRESGSRSGGVNGSGSGGNRNGGEEVVPEGQSLSPSLPLPIHKKGNGTFRENPVGRNLNLESGVLRHQSSNFTAVATRDHEVPPDSATGSGTGMLPTEEEQEAAPWRSAG